MVGDIRRLTELQRVALAALDAEVAFDSDMAARIYGASAADNILRSFETRYEVKRAGGLVCLSKVLGKRCKQTGCALHDLPGLTDHAKLWRRIDGGYIWTSEPYEAGHAGLCESIDICRASGLKMSIDARSWHFPGSTVLVVVEASA